MAFKVSSKIFLNYLQKSVCIIHGRHIFFLYNLISKKYFFLLLLFLGWKRKKNKSLFLDYICRLIWSIYLILILKFLKLFLTFPRVFEKYICYLLALCSRRRQSYDHLLFFACFLLKVTGSYPLLCCYVNQCSPDIETIYLIFMTNQLNGVLWDGKAGCKCLN